MIQSVGVWGVLHENGYATERRDAGGDNKVTTAENLCCFACHLWATAVVHSKRFDIDAKVFGCVVVTNVRVVCQFRHGDPPRQIFERELGSPEGVLCPFGGTFVGIVASLGGSHIRERLASFVHEKILTKRFFGPKKSAYIKGF